MRAQIIAIGRKMPKWCIEAYAEYAKRLTPFIKPSLVEIPLGKNVDDEGKKILEKIPHDHFVIALDEKGQSWPTKAFSKQIESWQQRGQDISFIIGGPDGLSTRCRERADVLWSLSPLTFPHPLVRVLLVEQLYRAFSLLKNHPYHRE